MKRLIIRRMPIDGRTYWTEKVERADKFILLNFHQGVHRSTYMVCTYESERGNVDRAHSV